MFGNYKNQASGVQLYKTTTLKISNVPLTVLLFRKMTVNNRVQQLQYKHVKLVYSWLLLNRTQSDRLN